MTLSEKRIMSDEYDFISDKLLTSGDYHYDEDDVSEAVKKLIKSLPRNNETGFLYPAYEDVLINIHKIFGAELA